MVTATLPRPCWADTQHSENAGGSHGQDVAPAPLVRQPVLCCFEKTKGHPWKGSWTENIPDRHLMTKSKE